jgi:hypothetical protein
MGGNVDQIAPVGTGALNTGTPDVFADGPATVRDLGPGWAGEPGQRREIPGDVILECIWA